MYDQRAHGESTGLLDWLRLDLAFDLLQVQKQLHKKYPKAKIAAVGISMGAHAVMNALSKEPEGFTAVWLDGAQPQSVNDTDDPQWEPLFFDTILKAGIMLRHPGAERIPSFVNTITTNPNIQFHFVGRGKESREKSLLIRLAHLQQHNIQSWIVPHGGHVTGAFDYPDLYKNRLLSFMDQNL